MEEVPPDILDVIQADFSPPLSLFNKNALFFLQKKKKTLSHPKLNKGSQNIVFQLILRLQLNLGK